MQRQVTDAPCDFSQSERLSRSLLIILTFFSSLWNIGNIISQSLRWHLFQICFAQLTDQIQKQIKFTELDQIEAENSNIWTFDRLKPANIWLFFL